MPEQFIYSPSAGSFPGIPGSHGSGYFYVDWDARTIRPAVIENIAENEPAPAEPAASTEQTAAPTAAVVELAGEEEPAHD